MKEPSDFGRIPGPSSASEEAYDKAHRERLSVEEIAASVEESRRREADLQRRIPRGFDRHGRRLFPASEEDYEAAHDAEGDATWTFVVAGLPSALERLAALAGSLGLLVTEVHHEKMTTDDDSYDPDPERPDPGWKE